MANVDRPRQRRLRADAVHRATEKGAGKCNSFVPGTKVLRADGTSKPIEQLKLGDKVKATDPATGKTTAEPVVATIIGQGTKHLVDLKVTTTSPDGSTGAAHVVATDGHPFYLPSECGWARATDLDVGDLIQPSQPRTLSRVTSVVRDDAAISAHNLTIDALHTYYVLVGHTTVLVHNSSCGTPWMDHIGEKHMRDTHYSGGKDNVEGKSTF
ncbi:polymorphic toxin-type HINT domain-containing protein [Kribbella alba]|uniref:polymorphic toxin-type HINT domain-containing protein n=1 Tax=Kribbella alba TaxID=190197 RepID=UPI0031D7933A